MLNTQFDVTNDVLVKLNQSTTQAFYTDAMLRTWANMAHQWAAAYYKWPFTQTRDNQTAWSSATEDYAYPTTFRPNSIRLLQVGGYRLQKTAWEDYQIFREEQSSGKDRVWSEFGGRYYINPNLDVSGTTTVWGQAMIPAWAGNDSDNLNTTVFSGTEDDGNEALVEEMISYALLRERAPTSFYRGHYISASSFHHGNATAILDRIWKRVQDEQFSFQTKNRSMWRRLDILRGGYRGELNKENQFPFL